ncbi:MAG: ester cyclase [Streptosporangiaceae bacterium]|nr:ester cyclase [Streptosporangiaceae bacterium]
MRVLRGMRRTTGASESQYLRKFMRRSAGRFTRENERTTMDYAATMRNVYKQINAGDIEGADALMADDFVDHEEIPGFSPTKEGTLQGFQMLRAAFPDLRMDAEDVLASGDKAVARVRLTGTQQGELMGIQPTGKHVDVQLIDIIKFDEAGLACEHWGVMDVMSMMQQLGVVPAGLTA